MLQLLIDRHALVQEFLDSFRPQFCQLLLVRLGIVVVGAVGQTLAIANHPHLAAHTAVDNGRSRKALLRMVEQPLDATLGCE